MKRILVLIMVLVFSFTACKPAQPPATDPTDSIPTVPSTQPTVDPESVPYTPISSAEDYFTFAGYTPPNLAGILQYLFHKQ